MATNNSSDKLRDLWQSQSHDSISFSAEELRRAANRLTRRVSRRNLREYAAAAIVVGANVFYLYRFPALLLRLGSGLIIAGILLVVFQLYRNGSAKAVAEGIDAKSCVDFHRSQLVRQRDLLLSVWKWYLLPLVPGLAVFILGQYQAVLAQPALRLHRGPVLLLFGIFALVCAALFFLVERLNRSAARKLQREIDALDAVSQRPNQPATERDKGGAALK